MDNYPDIDDKAKGISPWFRAGLVGTYHKGALIGLRWTTLTADAKGDWRFTDYKRGETGEIKVILIGNVPFENIESVDWRGDEYYAFPHLYCYFDARRKEPYEKLAFCEKREMNDIPFYTEVSPTPPCGSEVASLALSTDYDRRYPSPHRPYPQPAVVLSGRRPARLARRMDVCAWMGPHRQPWKGADCPLSYSTGGTGGP